MLCQSQLKQRNSTQMILQCYAVEQRLESLSSQLTLKIRRFSTKLVDSGLLNLDGCLKIGQVLGAKLTKTSDSLSPLTADNMEGYKDSVEEEAAPVEEAAAPVEEVAAPAAQLQLQQQQKLQAEFLKSTLEKVKTSIFQFQLVHLAKVVLK